MDSDITLHVAEDEEPITLTVVEAALKPEQEKTVSPQYDEPLEVLPDAGKVLSKVTVEPIPEPTATETYTENGSYNVARIGTAVVNVPQGVFPAGTVELTANNTTTDVTNYKNAHVAVPVPEEYAIGGSLADKSLTGYHIAEGVEEIASNKLHQLPLLETVEMPDSIRFIRTQAFTQDSKLSVTDLPASLESIESYAFFACAGLQRIVFHSTPLLAANVFMGCSHLKNIYVPWSEGEVANAPWGAVNATITYNYNGGGE